jgi:hypothetical protein
MYTTYDCNLRIDSSSRNIHLAHMLRPQALNGADALAIFTGIDAKRAMMDGAALVDSSARLSALTFIRSGRSPTCPRRLVPRHTGTVAIVSCTFLFPSLALASSSSVTIFLYIYLTFWPL